MSSSPTILATRPQAGTVGAAPARPAEVVPQDERLDRCFAAMSDPTRRSMLERLRAGSHTVSELARPLPMSLPAVQKHLRVLESAGLVVTKKKGRVRHCHLSARPMADVVSYLGGYEAFWNGAVDRLAELRGPENRSS